MCYLTDEIIRYCQLGVRVILQSILLKQLWKKVPRNLCCSVCAIPKLVPVQCFVVYFCTPQGFNYAANYAIKLSVNSVKSVHNSTRMALVNQCVLRLIKAFDNMFSPNSMADCLWENERVVCRVVQF